MPDFRLAPIPHSILIVRRPSPLLLRLRGVLVLLALLSQVGFGNAQGLRCDMHGMGAMLGDRTTSGAMAGGMMHHQSATHRDGGSKDAHGCDCTCIGDCSAAIALPTAPSATTVRVALVVATPRRPLDIEPARPTSPEPDRLLPFANGPPATALL
jgi:hypothetical protein